jgi:hypothetical protein
MFAESLHPHLDLIQQLIHIFGIPAIFGGLIWLVRTYDKATRQQKEISSDVAETKRMTMEVHGAVGVIQSDHLAHLASGMKDLAASTEKGNTVLASIDKGIAVLVDRAPRA